MTWDEFAKIAGPIKDVVLAISAAVTAWVATRGLNRWHREMAGKHQYDTARSLIKATYKLRDDIQACRSPFFRGAEFDGDEGAEGWRKAYAARMGPVLKALEEFETAALEAEALWGAPVRSRAQSMRACVAELYAAIESVLDDKRVNGENFKADREFGKRMRATVAAGSDDASNPLNIKIAEAVKAMEDELRPKMAR
jgi:hypothetical protein